MVKVEGLDTLLKEHPFFADMSDADHTLLAGCAKNESFKAGELIFQEGRPADKFYLIRFGAVALEFHEPGRDPLILETLQDGDVMGWSWIVPPHIWAYDARAVQVTRVVSLDAKCLRKKCDKDPALGYRLFQRFLPIMAARLRAARVQMLDLYANRKDKG